jgi:serine/threonine-protein kinase RsbT
MAGEERIAVSQEVDILSARTLGKRIAAEVGFGGTDLILIATSISEIARNLLEYGKGGEMVFRRLKERGRSGIEITSRDRGPGIPDIERALQDGYSTGKGLGLGLPGARRLMDELTIDSKVGEGTTIVMKKWVR